MRRKIWIISGIIAACAVIAVALIFAIYTLPPLKDKRELKSYLDQIPIYSENGKCSSLSYSFYDLVDGYSPTFRCNFNSIYPGMNNTEKYDSFLKSNGWVCVGEDFYRNNYERSYTKDKLLLIVHFSTYLDTQVELLYLNYNTLGSCSNLSAISIYHPAPLVSKDGSRYTPASYFTSNHS